MANIWRVYGHRPENGCCHFRYQEIFYLPVLSNTGLACNFLPVFCLLDQY